MSRHFRKNSEKILGIFAVGVALTLAGCDSGRPSNEGGGLVQAAKKGAFVILQEKEDGSYKILEEYPSSETRVVVKGLDGKERILSQSEIDSVLAKADKKIEEGNSNLTKEPSMQSGGLSLGEAILGSAAGAILGSYIGNKLFNNSNFQQNRRGFYNSPSAYTRSQSSMKNRGVSKGFGGATPKSAKSGFFGSSKTGASGGGFGTRRSFGGFGG